MYIRATEEQLREIELNPADEAVEISQNIAALAVTPLGGVPLAADMGMPMDYKDKPITLSAIAFEAEFRQIVDTFESRVNVENVTIEMDDTGGRIMPTVEVTRNGGQ
ncbi:MAG: hypothetical protein LUE11_04720 [Clostridia bacterium]|nr:hypothetical protein [Clostridia bacterium]